VTGPELLRRAYYLKGMIMTAQSVINQAVTELDAFFTDLSEGLAELASEGGAPVDTSQLQAVVGQIPALQDQLTAVLNPPPATTGTTSTTHTTGTTST
jgi:hypothetical protein